MCTCAFLGTIPKRQKKKVIESKPPANGKDPEAVNPQDTVLLDIVARIANDKSVTNGPIIQTAKGWLVVIGEGDVLPAVEMGARFLETGQTACVWSHSKYAFGPGTRTYEDNQKLPPYSNVIFELTLTQIVMDTSRLNPYFSIQKALSKKNIANDIYQYEWCPALKRASYNREEGKVDPDCTTAMKRAIRLYQKSAKEMETVLGGTYLNSVEEDHPQRHQCQQLMLDCLNNIVAVHLRQHEYHDAKLAGVEVLKQDSKNLKGLLRAAKATLNDPASTLEEVKATLVAAESQITYKNQQEEKELRRLQRQFKQFKQQYKRKTKEMFANKLTGGTSLLGDEAAIATTIKQEDEGKKETITAGKSGPTDKIVKDTTDEPEEESTENESKFWRTQIINMVVQVGIPLLLFLLFRWSNARANETLATSFTTVGDSSSTEKAQNEGEEFG